MKINAPFKKVCEVGPLLDAGADNLYCGVCVPGDPDVNDRPNNTVYNLPSLSALETAVGLAHGRGKTVSVTVNLPFCDVGRALAFIARVEPLGVDELVVSSTVLLHALQARRPACRLSLSVTNPVFNSAALDFFRRYGVRKVCLPRHLSLEEIASVNSAKRDVEVEVFVMAGLCPFVEGYCGVRISPRKAGRNLEPCHYRWKIGEVHGAPPVGLADRKRVEDQVFIRELDCGLCAVYRFKEMGVDSLKIEGRNYPLDRKVAMVGGVRTMIRALEGGTPSFEDFSALAKRYLAEHYGPCTPFNCYY